MYCSVNVIRISLRVLHNCFALFLICFPSFTFLVQGTLGSNKGSTSRVFGELDIVRGSISAREKSYFTPLHKYVTGCTKIISARIKR